VRDGARPAPRKVSLLFRTVVHEISDTSKQQHSDFESKPMFSSTFQVEGKFTLEISRDGSCKRFCVRPFIFHLKSDDLTETATSDDTREHRTLLSSFRFHNDNRFHQYTSLPRATYVSVGRCEKLN